MKNIVQVKNPRSGNYVKIDRGKGTIIGSQKSKFLNVPEIKKKKL